jgi:hypothetical protein
MIERRLTEALRGINENEFLRAVGEIVAIPETSIVAEPVSGDPVAKDAARTTVRSRPGLR